MPLRNVTTTDTQTSNRVHEMQRVVLTAEGVFAVWKVTKRDGTIDEKTIEITSGLRTLLATRAGYQSVLDLIRDDTFSRIGT